MGLASNRSWQKQLGLAALGGQPRAAVPTSAIPHRQTGLSAHCDGQRIVFCKSRSADQVQDTFQVVGLRE